MVNLNQTVRNANKKISEINNASAFSNNKIFGEEKNKSIKEKRNLIENIYINNFFVVFSFCCIRKRKNNNCYVLEEGINIVKEKLDVLNIFKMLYCNEQFLEIIDIKKNEIKMSDNCKQKLQQ